MEWLRVEPGRADELLRDAEHLLAEEHGGHRSALDELLCVVALRYGFARDRRSHAEPTRRSQRFDQPIPCWRVGLGNRFTRGKQLRLLTQPARQFEWIANALEYLGAIAPEWSSKHEFAHDLGIVFEAARVQDRTGGEALGELGHRLGEVGERAASAGGDALQIAVVEQVHGPGLESGPSQGHHGGAGAGTHDADDRRTHSFTGVGRPKNRRTVCTSFNIITRSTSE